MGMAQNGLNGRYAAIQTIPMPFHANFVIYLGQKKMWFREVKIVKVLNCLTKNK